MGKSEEKSENLVEKLRKGIKKSGQNSTPVQKPPWGFTCDNNTNDHKESSVSPVFLSARKLGASLYNLQRYRSSKMYLHHDHTPSLPELTGDVNDLRRHAIAAGIQNHRLAERNNHAMQPVSPASYGSSSMEVVYYNSVVTPSSSIDVKTTNFGIRTSTELIKVLNRIWALEEQNSANMSLVKALKKELNHSRGRIKELVRDRENDRHEIDDLKSQVLEIRKSKDHDKIRNAIQSMKDELEDERKLRKRSEALHRKLARELYEVKNSLFNATKELEKEMNSRTLLEDLCDEFAHGIKDYEQETHKLRQKYEKDLGAKSSRDRLILHISESWLDGRMQAKLAEGGKGRAEKTRTTSVVDKMSSEIESILEANQGNGYVGKSIMVEKGPNFRRSSLELIPLNNTTSVFQHGGDDENSDESDSYCFELNKPSSSGVKVKPHEENQNGNILKYNGAKNGNRKSPNNEKKKSEICEIVEEGDEEGRPGASGRKDASEKTNHKMNELIRKHYNQDRNFGVSSSGNSQWGRNMSPNRQWTPKLPFGEKEILEPSNSKLPLDLRENTLKAKLLEARTRGQRSRSLAHV